MALEAGYKPFVRGTEGDAERKHNKSRVVRMATRLCYVGKACWAYARGSG